MPLSNGELTNVQCIPTIVTELYALDPAALEDKIRERTCSVRYRGPSESSPESSHVYHRPLSAHTSTPPNVFIYDQEKYEESTCASINDIRTVRANECLWVDITGVSPPAFSFPPC